MWVFSDMNFSVFTLVGFVGYCSVFVDAFGFEFEVVGGWGIILGV